MNLICGRKLASNHKSLRFARNCFNNGRSDFSEQDPPQDALLKAIAEVSKREGRVGKATIVVFEGSVSNDSTSGWLALDRKVLGKLICQKTRQYSKEYEGQEWSYSSGVEDLGALWHDRSEELGSSFRYSSLSSSLKRDQAHQSPVFVLQGLNNSIGSCLSFLSVF